MKPPKRVTRRPPETLRQMGHKVLKDTTKTIPRKKKHKEPLEPPEDKETTE